MDFHQTITHKGIKVTATAAGHVLGAAMFTVEIDGVRVLYTGDYSMEEDRHLIPGSIPPGGPPDVLIVESTFGVTTLPPRSVPIHTHTDTNTDTHTDANMLTYLYIYVGWIARLISLLQYIK